MSAKWSELDAPFDDPRWDDRASIARRDLRGMLDRTTERAATAERASIRGRVQELPEVLDVALGYSVVRRADVLALLPTQASDSPEKP